MDLEEFLKVEKEIAALNTSNLLTFLKKQKSEFLMINRFQYQNYQYDLYSNSRILNREFHGISVTNSMLIIEREEQ